MNPKITSILEKAFKEKSRGGHSKALRRITAAIEEYPLEIDLYKEAIGLGLDAGEPLQTVKYFKKALGRFTADRDALYEFATALEEKTCDPVFGKYLLEQYIKNKNLPAAYTAVQALNEHVLADLLQRTRKKREALSSALRGGHDLDGEIAINETSEAILHLALGDIEQAARILARQIDSKTLTCDLCEPLLLDLEKQHSKNGHIRYALGSCYLSRGDINRGVQKIVLAIKLNPELVEDITRRLETAKGEDPTSQNNLKVALLEAYSMQGNTAKVTALARSLLDQNPGKSSQVLDLVKTYLEKNDSDWELEEFYLDASLRSQQTKRIRSYLERTWPRKDKRRNNLDWLDAHAASGSLPADLQVYFGKLVLEEGRTDWAVDIFKRTASNFPAETQSILHILDKQKLREPQIQELCEELKRDSSDDSAGDVDEFDIQSFEPAEFSLSSHEGDASDAKIELEDNAYDSGEERTDPESGVFHSEPVSLNDLADGEPPKFAESPAAPGAEEGAPEHPIRPATEQIPEEPENESKNRPSADPPPIRREPMPATESARAGTDFDSLYRDYKNGNLDNDAILDLIERAFNRGRLDEAKALLDFRPVTIRQEVQRILRLADYYIYTDRPLPALIALKSFDCDSLNREERRDHLTKLAACYRALKMFEAAHGVLINLMIDEPSNSRLAFLAKANYEDYLQERCEEALILEKVCFLKD
jgi:hypothetical protein